MAPEIIRGLRRPIPRAASLFGLLAWLLVPCPVLADAQPIEAPAPGSNLEVSLITFGPGTQVWERFGHNAIEIRDRERGSVLWYNYGMFDFAQKNFYLNFARGRMLYRIDVENAADELPNYLAEGRWIVRQQLSLSPSQRLQLSKFLQWNTRPENAQYRYDYFTANCATRVRDALDSVLDGTIKHELSAHSRGFTYRMDTLRLMRPEPVLMLGIDAGLGPFADHPLSNWEESFIPMQFMKDLRRVQVPDEDGKLVALVKSEAQIAPARLPAPPNYPPNWIWQALLIGIVSGLGLFGLSRLRAHAWARTGFAALATSVNLVCGIAGLVLLGLWTLTDHVAAWHNENLLLLNPLCLLLLPAWIGSIRVHWQPSMFARTVNLAIVFFGVLALAVKLFPGLYQSNAMWIALLLPVHIAMAAAALSLGGVRQTG